MSLGKTLIKSGDNMMSAGCGCLLIGLLWLLGIIFVGVIL